MSKTPDLPFVPGAPGSEPPSLEEPTTPRGPLPPKPEHGTPDTRTPTGAATGLPPTAVAQQGEHLTTSTGVRLHDTDHSLKAGERGPVLLQDHHLREKLMHFDHERIPERVVHARGAGAHGVFVGYGTADSVCKAGFLAKDKETPVFTRFSTVVGSRGSADSVRDTRGFSTKFYTDEGNFDLVGNNIPVFFIQDAIKFPDVVHAAKPHPDREIPQAQTAHDTFWDFVSLHTEAQHHTIWNMSDRGIPRSYRMMEGFGVHSFRVQNAAGETALVKFHWKPLLGVHSLVWEEAQIAAGADPDFHRRDLYDAIEAGAYPQWELGIQVMPDTPDQTFEGIDLLDPTKIVPEELAPVQPIGMLTLNRVPSNFFAEVEQVAFHPGHLVPGIDVTDDPLLQGRLFSYLDTQLLRLGGPNFNQIPVNAPHVPVNDMLRDGFHQHAVHSGVTPQHPNSLDGGNPFPASAEEGAYVETPVRVTESSKVRAKPASFDDHFSQPRMFYLSLTPLEQAHVVDAYVFELAKCYEETIKVRQLQALARIDADLCAKVAAELGLEAPSAEVAETERVSPAVSQVGGEWPIDGRMVGIVVDVENEAGVAGVPALREALDQAGMLPMILAVHGGRLPEGLMAQRTFATMRSIEFDAVVVAGQPRRPVESAGGADANPLPSTLDPRVAILLQEAFRHGKTIVAWGPGTSALEAAGVPTDGPGVTVVEEADAAVEPVRQGLSLHRAWDRFPV